MGGLFSKPKPDQAAAASQAAATKESMRATRRQERQVNKQSANEAIELGERRRLAAARSAGNMVGGGPRGVQDTLG